MLSTLNVGLAAGTRRVFVERPRTSKATAWSMAGDDRGNDEGDNETRRKAEKARGR